MPSDTSTSDTDRSDDLEDYPTEALETLSEWAEQRFVENIPDHGRGKNWLDDDPHYHIWRATKNLADSAPDGSRVKLTELGDALNHIVFAAEIEIRERREEADAGRIPCPECEHGRLQVSEAVYADCDNCDAAVLRNEVGI